MHFPDSLFNIATSTHAGNLGEDNNEVNTPLSSLCDSGSMTTSITAITSE